MNRLIANAFVPDDKPEIIDEDVLPKDISKREHEVLSLVLQGFSDKEIANELGISIRTASNHVAGILRKTKMTSRADLIEEYGKK